MIDIVKSTVNRSAWFAHSENIIQTMLCSDDQLERVIAVEKVLAIRGQGNPDTQLGDSSIRVRRTPIINFNAKKFVDLIICSDDAISEPPLTCSLTTTEL